LVETRGIIGENGLKGMKGNGRSWKKMNGDDRRWKEREVGGAGVDLRQSLDLNDNILKTPSR
jgi:hypothetical protein